MEEQLYSLLLLFLTLAAMSNVVGFGGTIQEFLLRGQWIAGWGSLVVAGAHS